MNSLVIASETDDACLPIHVTFRSNIVRLEISRRGPADSTEKEHERYRA